MTTRANAYSKLNEDVRAATLDEAVKELLTRAAAEACNEMRNSKDDEFEDPNGVVARMFRYQAGILTYAIINVLADDQRNGPVARRAKGWIDAWAVRNL